MNQAKKLVKHPEIHDHLFLLGRWSILSTKRQHEITPPYRFCLVSKAKLFSLSTECMKGIKRVKTEITYWRILSARSDFCNATCAPLFLIFPIPSIIACLRWGPPGWQLSPGCSFRPTKPLRPSRPWGAQLEKLIVDVLALEKSNNRQMVGCQHIRGSKSPT